MINILRTERGISVFILHRHWFVSLHLFNRQVWAQFVSIIIFFSRSLCAFFSLVSLENIFHWLKQNWISCKYSVAVAGCIGYPAHFHPLDPLHCSQLKYFSLYFHLFILSLCALFGTRNTQTGRITYFRLIRDANVCRWYIFIYFHFLLTHSSSVSLHFSHRWALFHTILTNELYSNAEIAEYILPSRRKPVQHVCKLSCLDLWLKWKCSARTVCSWPSVMVSRNQYDLYAKSRWKWWSNNGSI